MDKESLYQYQKIDCNCNDCGFMARDMDKFKHSISLHHKWQLMYFDTIKQNLLDKADWWETNIIKPSKDKAINLRKEANKMRFQFDKKQIAINYGYCDNLKKDVSFIPNTCQLDTQECFTHRKDLIIG